ncbi:hypothetical protein HBH72_233470 [Parastagonospora nodorum]|nr:hypothetical protein HBH72_233470 [Parastagonospora nodorum]
MCAKDDLIRQKSPLLTSTQTRLAGEPATAESITAKDPNHVDTFSSDFAFSFTAYYYLFADKLVYAPSQFFSGNTDYPNIQQSLPDRATVVLIIILVNKTQLSLISGDIAASFYHLQQERCLNKGHDDFVHPVNYFSTTLVTQESSSTQLNKRFHQVIHSTSLKRFNNKRAFTEAIIQQLIAIISLLFISKAPFVLHFIRAVYDLVTLAQYKRALERINIFKEEFQVYQRTLEEEKNFNYPKALDSIYTRANSKAHYITIVKQFYSITNKKEYILQIYRTYSTRVTRPLPFRRLRYKRYNNSKHCNEELYLILIIINYTCYDKDRKHIAYIRAFSKTLQAFKFYDLSTIIRLVHLVLRDLPNSITYTTMSYYVNNYIN